MNKRQKKKRYKYLFGYVPATRRKRIPKYFLRYSRKQLAEVARRFADILNNAKEEKDYRRQ